MRSGDGRSSKLTCSVGMCDTMDIVCVHELVQGFLDQVLGLVACESCNPETVDISSQTEVGMTAADTALNV